MSQFYFLLLCCLFPFVLNAQLYLDASNNLPANGANGQSMDIRAADLDNDGDLDIILANEFQANTILLNDGNGIFSNSTIGNLPQENHDSEDIAIADFNADGNLDLVFCSEDDVTLGWINVHEYYLGDGNGSFSAANFQFPDSEANAVIEVDINEDGFVDLLFGNNGATTVLINDENGSFSTENDRVPQINRTTQDLALADIDNDGDLDLFEGNENGNLLFVNDGNGFFTDETNDRLPQGLNIETRKVSFGDIDNDDDLDIFLSNVAFIPGKNPQNRLFINEGNGVFSDVTSNNLPVDNDHTIDAIFEDIDLDGDVDLIVCNVFGGPIKIYQNDGAGNFTNNTLEVLGQFYTRDALGIIARDFNNDGFKDIYICDRKTPNSTNLDLLLLRTTVTNNSELTNSPAFDFVILPNPASSDKISLQFTQNIPDTLSINTINGKRVELIDIPETFSNQSISINITNYTTGTYLIIAQFDDKIQVVKKLVVK